MCSDENGKQMDELTQSSRIDSRVNVNYVKNKLMGATQ